MPAPTAHLTAQSLEQLAEGSLSTVESSKALTHLEACARCSAELEAFRSLFSLLGELPRFAPSPAFADGVMAKVKIAPQESWVMAWLRRLVPTTKRGWVLFGTMLTAPATPFIAFAIWLLFQPLVSPTMVWQWTLLRAQATAQSSFVWLIDRVAGSQPWSWVESAFGAIQSIPVSTLGVVAAMLAFVIPLSGWALVRLTRTPVGKVFYAN